jgi:hypothetical protein
VFGKIGPVHVSCSTLSGGCNKIVRN